MIIWTLTFCVIPTIISAITVSSNGNSPEIKMIGGMMVDAQKEPLPPIMAERRTKSTYDKRKLRNGTKLSINERYRRLIPYMTFYYANDLISPTTERQVAKNIEVEKVELVEAKIITQRDPQPRKLIYNPNGNIPLYQGNRLTQHNIASSNPSKFLLKEAISAPQSFRIANYNPLLPNHRILAHTDYEYDRIVQKPIYKATSAPFSQPKRNPFVNLYNKDELGNLRYYISEKDVTPKYRLVPYEQTPPVNVLTQNENVYHISRPLNSAPVNIPKEQAFLKPRPSRPQYIYENPSIQYTTNVRKQPVVVSESFYEKQRPQSPVVEPVIESGFKPILNPNIYTTEAPVYESNLAPTLPTKHVESNQHQIVEVSTEAPKSDDLKPIYYEYTVTPTYEPPQHVPSNSITLGDLLNSLQLNKSIPKPITRENVGASIKTLLQVLNVLKAYPQDEIKAPVLSTPKPFVEKKVVELIPEPVDVTPVPVVNEDTDFQDEPYLAPVNTLSQHLDDYSSSISSQRFPQPVNSDDEGGTPGRPGVDYPVLTVIPETAFDCKTQRYKGFFADPETRCQVWHYCDLNGGQASFLCPNGTIFSQAALTCDWWFNVRCASTTQLYVLNESLYKYILPHSPKFPEDYSGPLVDKYLTLKFKEMEEQFKKNKNRQSASEKMDQDEEDITEDSAEKESSTEDAVIADKSAVSEASVIVNSPGTSGNVERLDD